MKNTRYFSWSFTVTRPPVRRRRRTGVSLSQAPCCATFTAPPDLRGATYHGAASTARPSAVAFC